jgi:hypothetical protein
VGLIRARGGIYRRMPASRVGVGDGLPRGSEHDQYLAEIRRLKAEIERRDAPMVAEIRRIRAEIECLLARDTLMIAEIGRLTAENQVLLRERERRREAEKRGGRLGNRWADGSSK